MQALITRMSASPFGAILRDYLHSRVRSGSIKAVKGYIQVVKYTRYAALSLVGLGALASFMIAGLMLILVGVVGLLPVSPNTVAIIILSAGVVMTLISAGFMWLLFSEKHWLEMSKSYELMEAALGPWEGVVPPNPMDVLSGEMANRAASEKLSANSQPTNELHPAVQEALRRSERKFEPTFSPA